LNTSPGFMNAAGFWALDLIALGAATAIGKSAPLSEYTADLTGCRRAAHDAVAGSRFAWHAAPCARLRLVTKYQREKKQTFYITNETRKRERSESQK
jgi:hypothetical protein